LHATKQPAKACWKKMQETFQQMVCSHSKVDLCLPFKLTPAGSIPWITSIDDSLLMRHQNVVVDAWKQMQNIFNIDEAGELMDYVGV